MSRITLGNVTIDRDRFEVRVDVRRVDLTFVEFELLYTLARNAGKVVARSKLMQAVWNEPSRGQDLKLTVHMSRLRKKMRGSRPWHIETITKRGYAFVGDKEAQMETENGRSGRRSPMSRGEVALVIASAGLAAGIVEEKLFSAAIVMTLVTTILTPIVLKFMYREQTARERSVEMAGGMAMPESAPI